MFSLSVLTGSASQRLILPSDARLEINRGTSPVCSGSHLKRLGAKIALKQINPSVDDNAMLAESLPVPDLPTIRRLLISQAKPWSVPGFGAGFGGPGFRCGLQLLLQLRLLDHQKAFLSRPCKGSDLSGMRAQQRSDGRGAGVANRQPNHFRRRTLYKHALAEVIVLGHNGKSMRASVIPDRLIGCSSQTKLPGMCAVWKLGGKQADEAMAEILV
ncbi:MAG: hypothetical protein VBE63_22845 [Lamprobacter sp.]|nr:hypothetical protein [Lamprobacter sp.]MEA3642752.1 hypothetical protein [Lamprobacter sp.]